MITAIVFDCFGVLTTDGWLPFRDKYFSSDPSLLARAEDLNRQTDAGILSGDDFVQAIAQLAALPVSSMQTEVANNVANTELFAFIVQELAPHYTLGLLSNASANWLAKLFTPDQIKLFAATALSYEMGVTKPDPRTYQTIAERLNVELEDCLFIDDQQRYCDGAAAAGMAAIWYQNNQQLFTDLQAALRVGR